MNTAAVSTDASAAPSTSPRPAGLTADSGWELTVEKIVNSPRDEIWTRLLNEWLPEWLGVTTVPLMVGAPLKDERGSVSGRVVGCHMGRRVRVRWFPQDLDHETMFQVTITEVPEGTQITIHQDRLLGPAARQALLERWEHTLEDVRAMIATETGQIPVIDDVEPVG